MHIVPPEELQGGRECPNRALTVRNAPHDGAGAVAPYQVRAQPAVPAPDGGQQRIAAWCGGARSGASSRLWFLQGATGDVSWGPLLAKAAGCLRRQLLQRNHMHASGCCCCPEPASSLLLLMCSSKRRKRCLTQKGVLGTLDCSLRDTAASPCHG